jgi:hypothetical protein
MQKKIAVGARGAAVSITDPRANEVGALDQPGS